MGMDAIPDDLLELILLLISSSVLLVRAASTCKQWRRIIAKSDFLRRFRRLHRPPVAGYYYDSKRFSPSSPPSAVDGRHFSLDFLPNCNIYPVGGVWSWRITDSRGSLLLLDHYKHRYGEYRSRGIFVCEPITRRFEKIPPTTLSTRPDNTMFLLDGSNVQPDGGISMSSFRVLCLADYDDRIHAGVFTSGDSWKETSTGSSSMNIVGVAMGSIYWYTGGTKVVTLDPSSAEFSSFKLPDIEDWDGLVNQHRLAVTAGHDGRARIVVGVAGGDMKVFARQPVAGGSREWVLEKRIPLLAATCSLQWREPSWYFNRLPISYHRTGAVVIITTGVSLSPGLVTTPLMFRLDIETMALERMPDPNMGTAYPCELPWPPIFRACTDDGDSATAT